MCTPTAASLLSSKSSSSLSAARRVRSCSSVKCPCRIAHVVLTTQPAVSVLYFTQEHTERRSETSEHYDERKDVLWDEYELVLPVIPLSATGI